MGMHERAPAIAKADAVPAGFDSAADFLAAVSESMGGMFAYVDNTECFRYANIRFAAWFGIAPYQVYGRTLLEMYGAEAYAIIGPRFARAFAGEMVRYERQLKHRDGSAYWISVVMSPHRDAAGAVKGVFVSSLEVDELKRTRDALDKALQVQAFHMDNSPLAVIEWSENVEVNRWSGQAEAIFGWSAEEVMGQRSNMIGGTGLVHPDWRDTIRAATIELLEGRVQRNRMIARNLTKSGRYIFCEWFNSAFMDASGRTKAILSLAQDVTLRVEAEEQLRYTAVHDALTGLMNRQSLIARLDHSLSRVRRTGEMLALMFIDLDKFKAINDTHGHATGDAFLRGVGERLQSCIREADTVARIGGDEFVVLLDTEVTAAMPGVIAERIRAGLARGFTVGELSLPSAASIGVSFYPADGRDADQLLASADRAMYRVKAKRAAAQS